MSSKNNKKPIKYKPNPKAVRKVTKNNNEKYQK